MHPIALRSPDTPDTRVKVCASKMQSSGRGSETCGGERSGRGSETCGGERSGRGRRLMVSYLLTVVSHQIFDLKRTFGSSFTPPHHFLPSVNEVV